MSFYFKSGTQEGKCGELVLLKSPDWAQALIKKGPDNVWIERFLSLIRKFDSKPFLKSCSNCSDTATRASVYKNTSALTFWCSTCDPYKTGASSGTLTIVKTFDEAIRHVDYTCKGNRAEKRNIIKMMSQAKGLPARVGEKQAQDFFS